MDKPATPEERNLLILNVLESIERTNQSIKLHESCGSPDRVALEQYKELRDRHLHFLEELMKDFGVEAHLSFRQAA